MSCFLSIGWSRRFCWRTRINGSFRYTLILW